MKYRQKFKHGDIVKVADDLGPSMEHFEKSCKAAVIASYRDQFGGSASREPIYTIFIEGHGESSWYYQHQLTFIEHNPALLETWKEHAEARTRDYVDFKWIKAQWPVWKKNQQYPPASSVMALLDVVGCDTVVRRKGEYYALYEDFNQAYPILNWLLTSSQEQLETHFKVVKMPEKFQKEIRNVWKKLNPA